MAYSQDLRKQILKSVASGMTIRQASAFYGISTHTINQWKRNGIERKKRQFKPLKVNHEALLKDVENYPDAFQYERAKRLGVTASAICYALKQLKISVKKDEPTPKTRTRAAKSVPFKIAFLQKNGLSNGLY
ncbi:IS630 transposase-related protein [Alysiella filiformis]|nr:IS630 transposase-related protein [Alysiella filiformis]QMT32128.1 helix-turn-helix domain-containing protein [Alysiella filiformis]